MKYTQIKETGLKISSVALGTWVFGGDVWQGSNESDCIDAVNAAIDNGINLIDTAPIYGYGQAEKIVGKALKGKRDKVLVATKCGLIANAGTDIKNDLSPDSINREIDESLKRLQTDYVDIYQCHWPDPNTPILRTLEALIKLKEKGKIKHIGVSNFDAELLRISRGITRIATIQNQYSMLERSLEKDVLPYCIENNIGVITYGPLAGGILTGKYKTPPAFKGPDARSFFYKFYKGEAFKKTTTLLESLRKLGKPLNQVAVNWLRQQKGITSVITGCRNATQAKENAQSASWDLPQESLQEINKLLLEF